MHINIIIPTYKPQSYLWECLDSVCRQATGGYTYEVLLVLNGPKEPYYTAIQQYITSHPALSIRFLYSEKAGVSAARNLALENAQADYITFIDDDDYVSPFYLKSLAACAAPDRIVMAKSIAFDDKTKETLPYRLTDEYERNCGKGLMPAHAVRSIYCGACMKLIPSSMIANCWFDTSLKNSEDALFIFDMSKRFNYIICAPQEAVYYRRVRLGSAAQLSSKKRIRHALRMLGKYTMTYLTAPTQFNAIFYITRMLGAIKGIFAKDVY